MTLIDALERAGEGSRELDAEIHRIKTNSEHRPIVLEHYPPHYTTSLDAALTQVPEGARIVIQRLADGRWVADVAPRGEPLLLGEVYMPSPALALCIAALRARQQ